MFANTINDFLFENALYLAIAMAGLILVMILVFILLGRKKKILEPIGYDPLLLGLGGNDNIVSVSGRGSRLSVKLKDYQVVQQDVLKANGVESLIQMSQKLTLLIAEAEQIAIWINDQISKK